jgi:hypothetical protein
MLLISGYFRLSLLWAMIPLTVFASRPVTGCTCASGEYKLVCMAHVFHRQAPQNSGRNARNCEKACSLQQDGRTNSADCCQTGQCPLSKESSNGGGKCCSPDLLTRVIVPSTVAFSVDIVHHVLFDLPVVEATRPVADSAVIHFVRHETGPPDDLVVSLHRLLI